MDHRVIPDSYEADQRIDWLRLVRSQNVGPRGIMAQTPEARRAAGASRHDGKEG
jgi:hypothetical protein